MFTIRKSFCRRILDSFSISVHVFQCWYLVPPRYRCIFQKHSKSSSFIIMKLIQHGQRPSLRFYLTFINPVVRLLNCSKNVAANKLLQTLAKQSRSTLCPQLFSITCKNTQFVYPFLFVHNV